MGHSDQSLSHRLKLIVRLQPLTDTLTTPNGKDDLMAGVLGIGAVDCPAKPSPDNSKREADYRSSTRVNVKVLVCVKRVEPEAP